MKGYDSSLVDVKLTNRSDKCFKTLTFNIGISDYHHMISTCTLIKGKTPIFGNVKLQNRCFKDMLVFTNMYVILITLNFCTILMPIQMAVIFYILILKRKY